MRLWTADSFEAALQEAARTMRRALAPDAPYRGARTMRSRMPDAPAEARVSYGYAAVTINRIKPTPGELARLDRMQTWTTRYLSAAARPAGLPEDINRILWARASGTPWPKIAIMRMRRYRVDPEDLRAARGGKSPIPGGNSNNRLRAIYQQGLEHMARCLNSDGIV